MPNSTDALLVNRTDIERIAAQQVAPKRAAGYKPDEIKLLALLDEPGCKSQNHCCIAGI